MKAHLNFFLIVLSWGSPGIEKMWLPHKDANSNEKDKRKKNKGYFALHEQQNSAEQESVSVSERWTWALRRKGSTLVTSIKWGEQGLSQLRLWEWRKEGETLRISPALGGGMPVDGRAGKSLGDGFQIGWLSPKRRMETEGQQLAHTEQGRCSERALTLFPLRWFFNHRLAHINNWLK